MHFKVESEMLEAPLHSKNFEKVSEPAPTTEEIHARNAAKRAQRRRDFAVRNIGAAIDVGEALDAEAIAMWNRMNIRL